MHRVHLITTGGTIEKRYVEQAGSMENTDPQIRRCLSMLRLPTMDITVEELMNKDSLFMTDADRACIAERALASAMQNIPVLITHGTDTVVETGHGIAQALRTKLPGNTVPILCTGAMTPFGIEGSDALQNLTEALLATRLMAPGVYLSFHGEVFPIADVKKDRENSRFIHL
jgi:L-asparaginase